MANEYSQLCDQLNELEKILTQGLKDNKRKSINIRDKLTELQSLLAENPQAMNGTLIVHANSYYDDSGGLVLDKEILGAPVLKLSKQFQTRSGVEIKNSENKVEISRGDRVYDFQTALSKYFDKKDKNRIIAQSINNFILERFGGKSAYELGKAVDDLEREEKQIKLLKESDMLVVFAVIEGEHGNGSLIWGLAEDKVTKEPFHWMTDLKADISVLVSQYR